MIPIRDVVEWLKIEYEYLDEGPQNYKPTPGTITFTRQGIITSRSLLRLPGANGENRQWETVNTPSGELKIFGHYEASEWRAFLQSIHEDGIRTRLIIGVLEDGRTYIMEGNHRKEAVRQLNLPYAPVEVRYFANSQRKVTQYPTIHSEKSFVSPNKRDHFGR